jgi:2-iminobutanoate/2-iminopropanoate deaminase
MPKTTVTAPLAPAAVGPYSHAVTANGMVYTAGQVGLIPGTKTLAEGGLQAQTRQALENIKAVLEASGANLGSVIKTTVFLQSMGDFAAMNEVYATYFTADAPARSTVAVAGLPLGAMVEIEVIALIV